MWAIAQRDGRPAVLASSVQRRKVWLTPTTRVPGSRGLTLLRRETRRNLLGCPKLAKRSQPFVGRSLPFL